MFLIRRNWFAGFNTFDRLDIIGLNITLNYDSPVQYSSESQYIPINFMYRAEFQQASASSTFVKHLCSLVCYLGPC